MHSTIDASNAGAEQKRAAAATIPFTSTLCGESRKELSTANLDANQIALPQFDLDRTAQLDCRTPCQPDMRKPMSEWARRKWLRQAPDHPIEAPQPPKMAGATFETSNWS